jgi:hypothetical protein
VFQRRESFGVFDQGIGPGFEEGVGLEIDVDVGAAGGLKEKGGVSPDAHAASATKFRADGVWVGTGFTEDAHLGAAPLLNRTGERRQGAVVPQL